MLSPAPRRTARTLLERHWASALYVLLAFAILAWVSWDARYVRMISFEPGADYWEHSATLHALIKNPWHPRHPHLALDAGSPRYGPQFLLIALIARTLHLNAVAAMALTAVLNTLLFLYAIRVFFLSYFRHSLAPLYGLLVMFGGWWLAYNYSNVYSLPVLFSVASFPSTTALGLTLLGFALTVRVLRSEGRWSRLSLLVLAVWAAAVFIIHPLTAMASLSGALLLALCEPNVSWRLRFEVAFAIVGGCALSHFWPYFSPWLVLSGGHGRSADWAKQSLEQAADLHAKRKLHHFYHTPGLLRTLGLSALALLALPYFFLRRRRWFVGLGALGMLVPFVANAFVDIPLGHRFVLLAILFLHIGLVWLLLRLTPGHRGAFRFLRHRALGIPTVLLVCSTLLLFFGHSVQVTRALFEERRFQDQQGSPVVHNMSAVASATGPNAIVLANARLSWPLPTFGPKVLLLLHDDPLVPDAVEREYAVKRFLGQGGTDEERRATLARYGVTHVLLERESGSPARFLSKISTVRVVGAGYRLYTLSPRASRQKP